MDRSACLVAAFVVVSGCSPIELPPPAPPTAEMPAVPAMGPPEPGHEWVTLDTPGDQALVSRVSSYSVDGRPYVHRTEYPLCSTPCTVGLREGGHTLVFQSATNAYRGDTLDIQLQGKPMVVRHVMAETRPSSVGGAGGALVAVGVIGIVVGAIMAPIGAATNHDSSPSTVETAGFASLGAGAGVTAIGAVMMALGRGEYAPGATTAWTIP